MSTTTTDEIETALDDHDAVRFVYAVEPDEAPYRFIVAVEEGVETLDPLYSTLHDHGLVIWMVDFEWRVVRLAPAKAVPYPELGSGSE